jgi:hypothetical protein
MDCPEYFPNGITASGSEGSKNQYSISRQTNHSLTDFCDRYHFAR